jgi:chitosanase
MIDEKTKQLIKCVINVFETGTPEGKYDALVVYPDGTNGSRQITYGRSQTTEQGNLKKLLSLYVQNGGTFSNQLSPYIDKIGQKPLADNNVFKNLLVKAAREDGIMRSTQDQFFDTAYYNPASKFFDQNQFILPLSMLVIYDSYIHSGSIPRLLRKRFGEYPPADGGDEKKWVTSYVDIRHQWLKYHTNPLLRTTIYRTQCFKDQIAAENWLLDKLPITAHGVAVGNVNRKLTICDNRKLTTLSNV